MNKRFSLMPICTLLLFATAAYGADRTEQFVFQTTDIHAIVIAPGALLAPFPSCMTPFTDPVNAAVGSVTGKLRNYSGSVIGIATEVVDIDLPAGVSHASWSLTIPGRGSLFLVQDENITGLLVIINDMLAHAEYVRQFVPPWDLITTVPDTCEVLGGTGDFEFIKAKECHERDLVYEINLLTGMMTVTDILEVTYKVPS